MFARVRLSPLPFAACLFMAGCLQTPLKPLLGNQDAQTRPAGDNRAVFAELRNNSDYPSDYSSGAVTRAQGGSGNGRSPSVTNAAWRAPYPPEDPDGTRYAQPINWNQSPNAWRAPYVPEDPNGTRYPPNMYGNPSYRPNDGIVRVAAEGPNDADRAPYGGGFANPSYGRSRPTVTGQYLQLGPQETATDRALYLNQVLEKTQAEIGTLQERAAALEQQLGIRDQHRAAETREIEQTTTELHRARSQMEAMNDELVSLRTRLRQLDKQELATLSEMVSALEGLVREPEPKKSIR